MAETVQFLLRHGNLVLFGVGVLRFLCYDAAGALLWAGSFVALGTLFSSQLEAMATTTLRLGTVILLRRNGITKVRPLAGGIEAWREQGFPVEPLDRVRAEAHGC